MEAGFWSNVARGLFAAIDRAIYGLIAIVYQLVEELAPINIFDSATIDDWASRVYVFIGIIMVFKVTFSLINYLVNPDSITDKNTGAGNIAKNIVVTLFLIILTPYAFDFLYRAQNAILKDDIIPKVILGDNVGSGTDFTMDVEQCGSSAFTIEDRGTYVAMVAFRPFYRLNKEVDDLSTVKDGYCHEESVKALLTPNLYKTDNQGVGYGTYLVDYSFLLSTAAGIVILILLLTTSMEIALRAIKLGFLELIAPIPIISYIDPKSGKDGIFKKWLKEVGKTWASLFIRLSVIYFAIYIISLADAAVNNLKLNEDLTIWAQLFVVIGALMFAKQFPKLIEDIFGIKLDALSLHPIKKLEESAVGGKAITGLGSGAIGAVGGGIAGFKAGASAGAPGRGTLMGIGSGFVNGKGQKNPLTTGMNKTYKNLTGNDMVNFTPGQFLMGLGKTGDKKVDEIKASLKTAGTRLRNAETKLNNASYLSSRANETLLSYGISASDINENKINEYESMMKQDATSYNTASSNYASALQEYNSAKEYLSTFGSNPDAMNDNKYLEAKATFEKYNGGELKRMEQEVASKKSKYETSKAIFDYASSMKDQNDARKEISDINREMSTLKDEKKDRERFYHKDASPKMKVADAISKNPAGMFDDK